MNSKQRRTVRRKRYRAYNKMLDLQAGWLHGAWKPFAGDSELALLWEQIKRSAVNGQLNNESNGQISVPPH